MSSTLLDLIVSDIKSHKPVEVLVAGSDFGAYYLQNLSNIAKVDAWPLYGESQLTGKPLHLGFCQEGIPRSQQVPLAPIKVETSTFYEMGYKAEEYVHDFTLFLERSDRGIKAHLAKEYRRQLSKKEMARIADEVEQQFAGLDLD